MFLHTNEVDADETRRSLQVVRLQGEQCIFRRQVCAIFMGSSSMAAFGWRELSAE